MRYFIYKAVLQWHPPFLIDGFRDLESSVAVSELIGQTCPNAQRKALTMRKPRRSRVILEHGEAQINSDVALSLVSP